MITVVEVLLELLTEPLVALPPVVLPVVLALPLVEVWELELAMTTLLELSMLMVQLFVTLALLIDPDPVSLIEILVKLAGHGILPSPPMKIWWIRRWLAAAWTVMVLLVKLAVAESLALVVPMISRGKSRIKTRAFGPSESRRRVFDRLAWTGNVSLGWTGWGVVGSAVGF